MLEGGTASECEREQSPDDGLPELLGVFSIKILPSRHSKIDEQNIFVLIMNVLKKMGISEACTFHRQCYFVEG